MIDDQFTPDERALVERLANAPQPSLKPAALDAIRQQLFDALDAPPAPPSAPSSPTPLGGMFPTVIVIVVIVASIIGVILFTRNTQPELSLETATPLPTIAPTEATIPALISTAEANAESTPEVTATLVPESTLQAEVTIEPLDTAIVIEGPVETINGNIVTIYGIDIELAPDDPLLIVIQVGDVIRVEGNPKGGDTVVVVAVNIIFINVDVVVQDGQVWRDSGNCNNPPPPWAPAHGWRRRCESSSGGGGGSGRGGEGSGSRS